MIPISQVIAAPAQALSTGKQTNDTEQKDNIKKQEFLSLEELVSKETGQPVHSEMLSRETRKNISPLPKFGDREKMLFAQAETAYKESNMRVDLQFLPDQLRQKVEELPSSLYV